MGSGIATLRAVTTPPDSPASIPDNGTMDWLSIQTLRNALRRHLSEVPGGTHLRDADSEAKSRVVRSDWRSIVLASTNGLAELLRLRPFTEAAEDTDLAIVSPDPATRKKSPFIQHAVLIECTASALLASHDETQRSLRTPKGQDLMTSLLKTISGAPGMPLTLWTPGGVVSGATTSLADFFSSAVDHLENKVSGEHHQLLRQQSARLSNTVLPDVVMLTTAQDHKVAVRIEDISAWTLGAPNPARPRSSPTP